VYAHRAELARATGEAKGASPFALVPSLVPTLWRPSALGFVLHAIAHGFMTPTWVTDLTTFDTGEQLDVPGRLRVIATPGHTEGHVCLLLEDQGILFTGDALVSYDVLTHAHGVRLMPDALNGDPARTRQSLPTLAKVDAGTLLFGHGAPLRRAPAVAPGALATDPAVPIRRHPRFPPALALSSPLPPAATPHMVLAGYP